MDQGGSFAAPPPGELRHSNNLLHLNPAASVVIVFCGLGASISFMGVLSLYLWWCGVDPLGNNNGSSGEPEAEERNKALREQLSKRLLDTLPVVQHSELVEMKGCKENMECCAVCLSDFQEVQEDQDEASKIRLLPGCGHYFHTECIQLWLCSYHSCPLCRSNLVLQVVVAAGQEDANRLQELLSRQEQSGELRQIVVAANESNRNNDMTSSTSGRRSSVSIDRSESGRFIVSLPLSGEIPSFMAGAAAGGSGRLAPFSESKSLEQR